MTIIRIIVITSIMMIIVTHVLIHYLLVYVHQTTHTIIHYQHI